MENPYQWKRNKSIKLKTLWQRKKFLIMCNFSFYHNLIRSLQVGKGLSILMLSDASVTDNFWKHYDHGLYLPQCFHLLFNTNILIYREFPYICQDMFKVLCCRFLVCGKGLSTAVWSMYTQCKIFLFIYQWTVQECRLIAKEINHLYM